MRQGFAYILVAACGSSANAVADAGFDTKANDALLDAPVLTPDEMVRLLTLDQNAPAST